MPNACGNCGERPRIEGQRWCRECRNAYRREWEKKRTISADASDCSKCGKSRDSEKSYWCRECRNSYVRRRNGERYRTDPLFRARVIAATRRWEKRNPGKIKARLEANADAIGEAKRRYRESPKGKKKAASWRAASKAQHRLNNAKWYEKNKGRVKANVRRWNNNNRDRVHAIGARRRARERGAFGSHTLAEWQALCRRTGDCCVYCNKPKRLTRDHALPLSRGGSDNIANILPACHSCNAKKRAMTAEEFVLSLHVRPLMK